MRQARCGIAFDNTGWSGSYGEHTIYLGIGKPYDKVNTAYSDSISSLDDLGDALGKTLHGENADKATGVTMRRWIGNAVSRVPIVNAVSNADKTLAKYKIVFKDDPATLVLFANALDDYLTTPTNRTSFKAEAGAKIEKAINQSKTAQVVGGAGKIIDKVMGKSDAEILNALEDLLRSSSGE